MRRLLFISPATPALTGNGLAMRAGLILEALSAEHAVTLLVLPIVGGGAPDARVAAWCDRVEVVSLQGLEDPWFERLARIDDEAGRLRMLAAYPRPALARFAMAPAARAVAGRVAGDVFDAVHVFRLYLAPLAEPYLGAGTAPRPSCRLDLDDLESVTRARLAALYEAAGRPEVAAVERAESRKYARMEGEWLPRFDRVYVCAEGEAATLAARHRLASVRVVPNGVRIPAAAPPRRRGAPFSVVFVGNMSYYPNEDAAAFFCREVLPRLRSRLAMPLRLRIVGARPPAAVRALAADPDVSVTGALPDLAAEYGRADAVVVPLRAGGGTRIKILEAFSYRRPVVSTTVGAEGLAVRDGEHLLIADDAETLAARCALLACRPEVGAALAARAFDLVTARHTVEHVRAALAAP